LSIFSEAEQTSGTPEAVAAVFEPDVGLERPAETPGTQCQESFPNRIRIAEEELYLDFQGHLRRGIQIG
jgi:hypothetical protein